MATKVNYSHNKQVGTTATDVISAVPSGVVSTPLAISFFNSNASTRRLVTVHLVENGGTADAGNIIAEKSIKARGEWIPFDVINQNLTQGMSLKATVDAGSDVNVTCSGLDDNS